MTKSHILNRKLALQARYARVSRRARRRHVYPSIGLRLLSGLLLGLALAATAFAQSDDTRTTTLLPTAIECKAYDDSSKTWQPLADKSTVTVSDAFGGNNKSACYLGFSITSLPKDANILEAVLRLVRAPKQPNPNPLVMNVASVPLGDWTANLATYEDQEKGFYLFNIRSRTDAVDTGTMPSNKSASLIRPEANGQYIGLLLSPQKSGSGRNYFPSIGATDDKAGTQPRLILKYTVPRAAPTRSPDSQSDGWASMRSPKAFMPEPNTPPQNNYKPIQVFDGTRISSYKAASFGGLNHVVRTYPGQNNTTEWRLDAQDVFGNVVWSKPLSSALSEKARVVVNDAGRLTIVSQNRFMIYQLNAANPRLQPSPLLSDKVVPGVKRPAAILPAADGGLYVIDDTDLYALNPDLQMLWRTGVGTSEFARMTLSPDGQYLYATVFLPDGNNKKPGLLAINAQSGKAPPLFDFPSETKTFHNPVVIKHPDGNTDYIYIAANSQNGVLRTVKNTPTLASGDRIASLSQVKEETGLFSQPAPDATAPPSGGDLSTKKLYVVRREDQTTARLIPLNAQTGALETNSASPAFVVGEASELWSGGNLAMDKKGNIFFWENGKFYGYTAGSTQLFARNLDGLPSSAQLLFGSDGTLYLQDSKIGTLSALIPSYQLPNAQSINFSSPTHLRVEGTVDKEKTTLSAGGNVTLGGEFKVKQGATLTVKTNVPPQ